MFANRFLLYKSYILLFLLVLLITLFFPSLLLQYISFLVLLISIIFYFVYKIPSFKKIHFYNFILIILLIFWCLISFFINYLNKHIDEFSLLIWCISYLPPFLLYVFLSLIDNSININKELIFKVFKYMSYLQALLILITGIRLGKFNVIDAGSGTLGDANFSVFFIYLYILYLETYILFNEKKINTKDNLKIFIEILVLFIIGLMAEATAVTIFFLLLTLFLFIKRFKQLKIIVLLFFIFLFFIFNLLPIASFNRIKGNYNYFKNYFKYLDQAPQKAPELNKFYSYYLIFSGKIFKDVNIITGYGPSSYSSRASLSRIPEMRINKPPFEIPYFKSYIVEKYLQPIYLNQAQGWGGNSASAATSFISIIVELGIVGLFIFILFFINIFKYINSLLNPINRIFLNLFTWWIILFLIYMNIWEYPIIMFTYFIFLFSLSDSKNL